MAVRNYYTMPDQATQDAIRAAGDTIQVIDRPSGPTASAMPQYGGMQASTFQGDPNLFGTPTHDSGVAQRMQDSIQGGIEDQMYRQAQERYNRALQDYEWNVRSNPAAIQSGLISPPDFTQTLAQVRGGWNDEYARDFGDEQQRYGTPAPYQAGGQQQAQQTQQPSVNSSGFGNRPINQSASMASGTGSSRSSTGTRSTAPSQQQAATQSSSPAIRFGGTSRDGGYGGSGSGDYFGSPPPSTGTPENPNGDGSQPVTLQPGGSGYGGGGAGSTPVGQQPQTPATPPAGNDPNYIPPGAAPPLGDYMGNQNPYQNFRYQLTDHPRYGGVTPYTGGDITQMNVSDRNMAIGQGDTLDASMRDYSNYQYGRAANYEDLANSAYAPIARGEGGYSAQERNDILRSGDLAAMRTTGDQFQSNYLTDAEQQQIMGYTGDVGDRLREGSTSMDQILNDRSSIMRGNLGSQDSAMRGAIGNDLNYDSDIRGHSLDASNAAAGNMRTATNRNDMVSGSGFASRVGALNSAGESGVRGAVDANQMRLSNNYTTQQNADLASSAAGIRSYDPNSIRTAAGFGDSLIGMADQGAAATRAAYNPSALRQSSGFTGGLTSALDQGTSAMNAAVDDSRLQLDAGFRGSMESALSGGEAAVRAGIDPVRLRQDPAYRAQVEGALGTTEGNVRGAIDRNNLTVSDEFNDRYNWTERDSQDIVDRAGRTVQNQTQSQQDQLQRAAFAQGNTSPLAMAAARDRAQLTGGVNAADAMTDARMAAKQAELETARQRETMRLGAEQTYSDLYSSNEQALGGRRVAAMSDAEQQRVAAEQGYSGLTTSNEQQLSGRRVAALADTEQLRQNAERGIADFRLQAADSDANRRVGALTNAEQMRMQGEQYGAGLSTSIEQDAANRRVNAATQGENLRQSGAQSAVQLGTQQEANIGDRAVNARNTAEGMRLNSENNLSALRSDNERYLYGTGLDSAFNTEGLRVNSAQSYANLANQMENDIADRTIGTLRNAENDRLSAAQQRANMSLGAEQYLGSSRLNQEQNYADAQQQNQQWMTGQAINTQQWQDEQNSQRASQVANNRQATNQYNQQQQYGQGMDSYNAQRSANTQFADQRRADEQEYRGYTTGQQNQANQNYSVGQQQRLNLYGTQMGAQQGATRNAISNYAVPGLGERIFNGLADGGIVKGPQPVMVGEEGPELVINLRKNGDRYERMGAGGIISRVAGAAGRYAAGRYGQQPQDAQEAWEDNATYSESGTPEQAQQQALTQPINTDNPIYRQILETMLQNKTGFDTQNAQPQAASGGGGGAISSAINIAKLFGFGAACGGVYKRMADGGVAEPYQPERYEVAPGVQYVNGPQFMELGQQPQAVLPLTKRPDAKVKPEMLPALHARYGA